jgi:hypothetical protein
MELPPGWPAFYRNNSRAEAEPASVTVVVEGLAIATASGSTLRWKTGEFSLEQQSGGLRAVRKATGETLIVEDAAAARALLAGPSVVPVQRWHVAAWLALLVAVAFALALLGYVVFVQIRRFIPEVGLTEVAPLRPDMWADRDASPDACSDKFA